MAVQRGNETLDPLWERISVIFHEWYALLELDWCNVTLYRSDAARPDDSDCAADTDSKWQYRQARIAFYLPALANHDDSDLESVIVHELVHVMINGMESKVAEKFTDQCELAVENVTRALIAARER